MSSHNGGILTSRKIAAMAEAHGVGFAPHTWTNGLGLAANLQVPDCPWERYSG